MGLPFSNYGRDKHKLIEYYMSEPELNYIYEGNRKLLKKECNYNLSDIYTDYDTQTQRVDFGIKFS